MCNKQQDLQLLINLTRVYIYMTISNYLNIVLVFDAKLKLQNSKWLNLFLKDNMHRNFLAVVLF